MARILIVDDDDLIRRTVRRLLSALGHDVLESHNGKDGLQMALSLHPDILICDINMPSMDGFALLEKVRISKDTSSLAVIMLTALDDRSNFRRGMALGADDYLSKPFTRDELIAAVETRLQQRKRLIQSMNAALISREHMLQKSFKRQLEARSLEEFLSQSYDEARMTLLSEKLALPAQSATPTRDRVHYASSFNGTILNVHIRHFTGFAERMSTHEITTLLSDFFSKASAVVIAHGALHLRYEGDSLLAAFSDPNNLSEMQALKAAFALTIQAQAWRKEILQRYPHRGLPELSLGIGLARGELSLVCFAQGTEPRLIGDPVYIADQIKQRSAELGWSIAVTENLFEQVNSKIQEKNHALLRLAGRSLGVKVIEPFMDEVATDKNILINPLSAAKNTLHHALEDNAQATARAVKRAYEDNLLRLRQADNVKGLCFKGYQLDRKIGKGGMSDLFLANREKDKLQVVLKVLDMRVEGKSRLLSRFIQEYTLLSRIHHPNVVRIYDQGITEDSAFIAMEYLDGGDLTALIKKGLDKARALKILLQAASALAAVHEQGIVHRDLKPENLMLRKRDQSVVLADFGISKDEHSTQLTQHEHIIGTPYYLSPEQATSGEVDARSDLYSLGVIFYELLTGNKPFHANSIAAIIGMHINAPLPKLNPPDDVLQAVLNRLMAKKPNQRFNNALELIESVQHLIISTYTLRT